jgi:hypothetical protein
MRQIDPKMVSKGPIVSIFKPMMSTVTEGHFGPTPPAVICKTHGVNQIPSNHMGKHVKDYKPHEDQSLPRRLLMMDTSNIDHLVILNNKPNQKLQSCRWPFTGHPMQDKLPAGRLLICLCDLHKDNDFCTGCYRLIIRPKHPKFRRLKALGYVQDSLRENSRGLLIQITSHKSADSLQYTSAGKLTQADILFTETDCNKLQRDGMYMLGRKFHLYYNKKGTLKSTCSCDRWEATNPPLPRQPPVHWRRIYPRHPRHQDYRGEQERSSDEEY